MRHPARTVRRLLLVICAVLLLLPGVAAATPFRAIDLDGDDRHDQVTLNTQEPEFRARHSPHLTLRKANAASADDHDAVAPCALMPGAASTGPALETFQTQAPRTAAACRLLPAIDPFAPRPPPRHGSL